MSNVVELHKKKVTLIEVHTCQGCDKSYYHIAKDGSIICVECKKRVSGWHAYGPNPDLDS